MNAPEAMKLCPWAIHVHAKSYDFDDEGKETTVDYTTWIRNLKKAGFRGFLTVEFEGIEEKDEVKEIRKTIRLIEKCLKGLR